MNPATVPLVPIAQTAIPPLGDAPARVQSVAVAWLNDLFEVVTKWDRSFRERISNYPGLSASRRPEDYEAFLTQLVGLLDELDERSDWVKASLCSKLIHLRGRLERDFAFLKQGDPHAFEELERLVDDAYRSEVGIIDAAKRAISDIVKPYSMLDDLIASGGATYDDWWNMPISYWARSDVGAEWHAKNYKQVNQAIQDYQRAAVATGSERSRIAHAARIQFVSLRSVGT